MVLLTRFGQGIGELLLAPIFFIGWLLTPKMYMNVYMKSGNKLRIRITEMEATRLTGNNKSFNWEAMPFSYTILKTIDVNEIEAITIFKL